MALLIFIIAVLGVWEGLKATRACCSRQGEDGRPQLRALSKREKLRQAVSEAIEREIPSTVTSPSTPATEGLRRRRSSESSSPPPPPLPVAREYHGIFVPPPPPPIIHVHAPSPAASVAPEPVCGTFREVASGSSCVPNPRGSRGEEVTNPVPNSSNRVSQEVQTDPVLVSGHDDKVYLSSSGRAFHENSQCHGGLPRGTSVVSKNTCGHCLNRKGRGL